MKKLAVFFPGIGYTVDKPLMHYSRRLAADAGFEVLLLPYAGFPHKVRGDRKKMEESYGIALSQSRKMLSSTDFSEYGTILFIGKSIGTIVAGAFGIPTTSLVVLISIAGLALSLSVQNILSNLFSGLTLLISKPFKAGDYVEVAGKTGIVKTVGLFYTQLNTLDNIYVNIPNSDVTGTTINNYSREPLRRVDRVFSAPMKARQMTLRLRY